jgi:hypothetical protein
VDDGRERDEHRAWIASNWPDIERVLRRKGESDLRIARLKRDVLGA